MLIYSEQELEALSRDDLIQICRTFAIHYQCPLENIAPYGASKECLIDTILECQESKGGS